MNMGFLLNMLGEDGREVVGVIAKTVEAAHEVGDELPLHLAELCAAAAVEFDVPCDLLTAVVTTLPGPDGDWHARAIQQLGEYLRTAVRVLGLAAALVKLCDKRRAGEILGAYVLHTARRVDPRALSALVS